jgi:Tol biopolymer transport system component
VLPLFAALLALGAAGCGHEGSSRRKILFLSDRDGDWALYTMDANGGDEHRVLPAGRVLPFGEGVGYGEPVVSPDGRKVLLARRGLTVATLATGASTRVVAGEESSAAWSPDGTRLVFSGGENEGLYVVDLRDRRRGTLLRRSLTSTPAWSPDGKWIAFVRQIGYGPVEVYAVHPDGSGLRRLTGYAPEGRLAWSRDGRLAFVGTRGSSEVAHLVVVDVRRRLVDVMPPRLGGGGTVAWSPDGRRIAYAATTGRSEASAIYTVDAEGGGRRRLTPSQPPYDDASPVWSPDGKSLLFMRAPVGGGAERGVSEVWTMRADGSHQRPFTKGYPDGGDNVEPAWIRGATHAEPAPRPREVRSGKAVVLQVPFAVDGISAEGGRAAIAPVSYEDERESQPTPPILLWRPGHGEPARLIASPCGGVQQVVLARNRLAFDCNQTFLDLIEQSLWVYDLRTRVPREVFFGHGGGPTPRGIYLDHIVGGSGLLAFGSERRDARGIARRRTLWRIDRFDSIALRSAPDTGDVVAASGGRLAVELANGRVAILRTNGALVRVLPLVRHRSMLVAPFGIDPRPPFLLAGRDLLLLEHRMLRAYGTATGKVRWARRVPVGAQLEAANGRLVVYTAGSSIHVLSRGSERAVHTGARRLRRLRFHVQRLVHAALSADGLYYCFNVADRRYPGRVVFVPRGALPR